MVSELEWRNFAESENLTWALNYDNSDWEAEMAAVPKKTIKLREAPIKQPAYDKLSETLAKVGFHACVLQYTTDDNFGYSGKGAEQGYFVWVAYEPKKENQVVAACEKIGIKIKDAEARIIDPDTPYETEQLLMYLDEPTMVVDDWQYEIVDPNPPPKGEAEVWNSGFHLKGKVVDGRIVK
eukprot:gnl/MRDRNA2_/MRDRNA2_98753_c0_seq1.p1 gnl/MRDRNA2_/MRDRNA2_98753_c0~~gnl/MRDRNA2_/MRDRNA2_98753_c0_seq1.p1  ORF type:complete len:211 (+),score=48.71 gnl/MRDRNA2_/MRDRNA2_98753_c0_seq1:91-633(+)